MYFQQINASDAEAIFAQAKNAWSTAAITVGQAVCWAFNGTSDGLAVTQPTTALLPATAGLVADASIAVSGVGRVQVYGLHSSGRVSGDTNVTAGNKLSAKTGVWNLIKAAGTLVAGESGVLISAQSYTTTATAVKKVFVRCL